MEIMISVNPPYSDLIFSGYKMKDGLSPRSLSITNAKLALEMKTILATGIMR